MQKNILHSEYTTGKQNQIEQNKLVLKHPKENGEAFSIERQVDHWIYFKNENDRSNFSNTIQSKKFKIETTDFDKSLREFPYSVQASRIDKVDLESVNEYTIYLWEAAIQFNGDYDGWETSVEIE